jgi:hypothetical protein
MNIVVMGCRIHLFELNSRFLENKYSMCYLDKRMLRLQAADGNKLHINRKRAYL